MMTIMPESKENLLVVRATEKLTSKDYEEVFIPELTKLIDQFGKIRSVIYLDPDFDGWELGAMWDDAKFGLKHRKDFEKIAVVGASKWIEWGIRLGNHLMEGQMKTFDKDQLDEALAWSKTN